MSKLNGDSDSAQYRNGDNIHFDYNERMDIENNVAEKTNNNSNKKKKKKKKKTKNKAVPANMEATINESDGDYPNSRVIKQGPNGDVIVERLPNEDVKDVWFSSATPEEKADMKKFWDSLDRKKKSELVKMDKEEFIHILRLDPKQYAKQMNSHFTDIDHEISTDCTCQHCGRRQDSIINEIGALYELHIDDIAEFVQDIGDLNDISTLPNLLFGGFRKLQEEHAILQTQKKLMSKLYHDHDHDHEHEHEHEHDYECHHDDYHEHCECDDEQDDDDAYGYDSQDEEEEEVHNNNNDDFDNNNNNNKLSQGEEDDQNISRNTVDMRSGPSPLPPMTPEFLQKLFDADVQSLKNIDFEKMKESAQRSQNHDKLRQVSEFKEFLDNDADKIDITKRIPFIVKRFTPDLIASLVKDQMSNKNVGKSSQFSTGLSKFVEDLIQNNGNAIIDMMESLSESRTDRQELLNADAEMKQKYIQPLMHDGNNNNLLKTTSLLDEAEQEAREDYEDEFESGVENEEYDEVDVGHDFEEEEEKEDYDEENYEEDEDDMLSNSDCEFSAMERLQELRQLLIVKVIQIFRHRLKKSYMEKLSQDRTQKLIEELEAEENAKKERELKKLKQKEKAKEKKRLQQLAKEEERKRREDEIKAKEEEEKQRQEDLKAEQRRKKEAAQRKKDEEKKKRIEEQQKRLEMQKEKEEEAKRAKELEEQMKQKNNNQKKLKQEEMKKTEQSRMVKDSSKIKETLKQSKTEEENKKEGNKEETERSIDSPMKDKNQDLSLEIDDEADAKALLEEQQKVASMLNGEINDVPEEKASNPLLEMLQKSNPRSLSSTSSENIEPHFNMPPQIPTSMSNMNNGWMNSTNIPNSPIMNPQYNSSSTFSPFTGFKSIDNGYSMDPFNPTGSNIPEQAPSASSPMSISQRGCVGPPPGLATAPSNKVWAPSATTTPRSNSIWSSNTTLGNTTKSIWGNELISSNPVTSTPTMNNPTINEIQIIQDAAYQAFQILKTSNQLEFGLAPGDRLFHLTKEVIPSMAMNFNKFLSSCSDTAYMINHKFEFIYDDFGAVSHIRISDITPSHINHNPDPNSTMQSRSPISNTNMGHAPSSMPPGLNIGLSNLNGQPLMGSMAPSSLNNGANKGLWN